jgi:DNA-binding transcriptional LysR family regulator
MGVRLFDRVGRRSVVNAAGRVLYDNAIRLFEVADELRAEMDALRGTATGRLVLVASVTSQYALVSSVVEYQLRHPHADLVMHVGSSEYVESMVLGRSAELGFTTGRSNRAELDFSEFAQDELVAICSPGHWLARASNAPSSRLSRETWFLREPGSAARSASDDLFAARGVVPSKVVSVGSQEAIKQLVAAGGGVGIAVRSGLEPELGAGKLVAADVASLRYQLRLHAVVDRHRRLTDAAEAFLEILEANGTVATADRAA